MRSLVGFATAALFALASPKGAHACAGCRNPNMPITRLQAVHLAPGEMRASAILGATSLNVVHPAGCADLANCEEVPVQPTYLHDQRITPAELRPVLELGITNTFGAELHLPFRLVNTSIQFTTPQGGAYEPLDANVHHRDETLAGMGDPWLLSRWNTVVARALITLRAGVSVPLGKTEPNPFALGDEGKRHQHIQFGSGTFDPVASLELSRVIGKLQFTGYAQMQTTLYENRFGFQGGTRVLTGTQVGRRFLDQWNVAVGGDVAHEGADRWDGKILQDGNLGRTEILAGASLLRTFGATVVGVTLRFPLWRRISAGDNPPGTLSSPVMFSAVLSHTFAAPRS